VKLGLKQAHQRLRFLMVCLLSHPIQANTMFK